MIRYLAAAVVLSVGIASAALGSPQRQFAELMDAAMSRMHTAMAMKASGNVDRDFATMMIAHHQGAIEMAEAELGFGRDERLRRLAQGIIVEQRQEISVMQQTLERHKTGLRGVRGEQTHMGAMK